MFHQEKIIDGILHWRGTPNGKWIPYAAGRLTIRLTQAERQRDEIREIAREAVMEERAFWSGQKITEDNRPPDWLARMEAALG